jgi:sugar lactone lactonase YvrE
MEIIFNFKQKDMRIILLLSICLTIGCTGHKKPQGESQSDTALVVLDIRAQLGEGAIWNQKDNRLWWVDIEQGILHIFNPDDGSDKEYSLGRRIGTVVPSKSGKALVALEDGLNFLDLETGELTFIADPEADIPAMRFNDGKCDPAGRLWVGSMGMEYPNRFKASLYRLDHDLSITKMLDSITVSNGICWSLDKTKMYYIDTPTMKVRLFDYDNKTGEISNGRTAVEIPAGMGGPDGMTIDSEGHLWVCLWGGSCVGCFDPETGKLICKINVPAKNVTSCAFGGKDLRTLYITSASTSMSPEDSVKYPLAGRLFAIELEVEGVQAFFFRDQ